MLRTIILGLVVVLACSATIQAQVVIETVTVGNQGNDGEWSGERYGGWGPDRVCGAVDHAYKIGKFEVTAGQYAEFLNAVAAADTYGLYSSSMADPTEWTLGCNIQRAGFSGSYTYSVTDDWADRPVNYVSWGDAARFANWLHNDQPMGAQDATTTEDGSYFLEGAITDGDLIGIEREPDATWVIPSEDEWYKAAYHCNDGATASYHDYPTQSDTAPTAQSPPGTDMTYGSANYYGSDWALGAPYYRTEVGAYEAKPSDSPYGTFDQGGNLWEWNEAVLYGSCRGRRGGSFSYEDYDLHAAVRDFANYPADEDDYVGFRVAKVSGPACNLVDADGDGDVDLADFSVFQSGFSDGDLSDYAFFQDCLDGPSG